MRLLIVLVAPSLSAATGCSGQRGAAPTPQAPPGGSGEDETFVGASRVDDGTWQLREGLSPGPDPSGARLRRLL